MSHVSPFQRDPPADTAHSAGDAVWRRLKVGISFLLSSWANGRDWFSLRMLFKSMFVCLIVCLLAFLLLRHIYVFCSTRSRREKLAFSDEYILYSLQNVGDDASVLSPNESDLPASSVRSPRRMLECTRWFWRMTEERTLPRWTWQTKVPGVVTHKHSLSLNPLTISLRKIFLSSRFQGLDERSFQFHWWAEIFCARLVISQQISFRFCLQAFCCCFFLLAANSSTPLKITSTDQGIRLYTFVSYYNDLLQVTWQYKSVLQKHLYLSMFIFVYITI